MYWCCCFTLQSCSNIWKCLQSSDSLSLLRVWIQVVVFSGEFSNRNLQIQPKSIILCLWSYIPGFHDYRCLTLEQMEIFLRFHNGTTVRPGKGNGNVGRMRPHRCGFGFKETRRKQGPPCPKKNQTWRRQQIRCPCIPPLLKKQNIAT